MVTEKYHQNKLHHLLWVVNWALKFFLSPSGVQEKCMPAHVHCGAYSVCWISPPWSCRDTGFVCRSAQKKDSAFSGSFSTEGSAQWTNKEKAGCLGNVSNLAEIKHNRLYQLHQLTLNLQFSEILYQWTKLKLQCRETKVTFISHG